MSETENTEISTAFRRRGSGKDNKIVGHGATVLQAVSKHAKGRHSKVSGIDRFAARYGGLGSSR